MEEEKRMSLFGIWYYIRRLCKEGISSLSHCKCATAKSANLIRSGNHLILRSIAQWLIQVKKKKNVTELYLCGYPYSLWVNQSIISRLNI